MKANRPALPTSSNSRMDQALSSASVVPPTHELKCWPQFFEPILEGRKTHDLRRSDDRSFSVGDKLLLREFDPKAERYTGREVTIEITFITSADIPCALSAQALDRNFCILSIRKII